jgi:hypothetical protein
MIQELSWPHLLYVNGDGVDYDAVEQLVSQYDHFQLGPFYWILKGLPQDRRQFSEKLRADLPLAPEKSEFYLCPLSSSAILHTKQGGFGLSAWLNK